MGTGSAGWHHRSRCDSGASVVLSFAAWLYGMAQQRRFAGKRHLALFAVTAALILAVIVPLPSVIKNGAPVQTAAHIEEVKWSPQNVADNRGHGKAIFVNFTASWCITCQVNEKTSLTTQAVKEALARTGTLYMVADSTKFNADIDDAMNALGQGSCRCMWSIRRWQRTENFAAGAHPVDCG
jgi:thiol:disulfide interchange protein DsbD